MAFPSDGFGGSVLCGCLLLTNLTKRLFSNTMTDSYELDPMKTPLLSPRTSPLPLPARDVACQIFARNCHKAGTCESDIAACRVSGVFDASKFLHTGYDPPERIADNIGGIFVSQSSSVQRDLPDEHSLSQTVFFQIQISVYPVFGNGQGKDTSCAD